MAGDAAAFDDFVAARSAALVRAAYLLCGDRARAEDLVQVALVKTWQRWQRVGDIEHVEAYVRRVVFTSYLAWWRRERETAVSDVPDRVCRRDDAAAADIRHDVVAALRRLPRGQRAIVVLRFYEDLTEAQTAAVLGCAVGTVKSQTARALARLRNDRSLAFAVAAEGA